MTEQKGSLVRQLYMPAVLCTALWGSAAPCIKAGYGLFGIQAGQSFSQLVFAGWRFALAGLLVLLVAKCKKHRIIPRREEWRPILWISLFQSMIQYICYYIGLSMTTGLKGSVLSGTQTFFALIFAHLFLRNDKLNRQKSIGCLCGLAGVLVLGMGGLNGFNLSEAEELVLRAGDSKLHISGLLVSGILIASLGAVMDVAMSIASSCNELRELNPNLTRAELFRSGMNIGRDAMGTMANTLILAFAGASLNMLILFRVYDYPLIQIANTDAMAVEVIRGVAGSIGIVLTVPLVALLSSRFMGPKPKT